MIQKYNHTQANGNVETLYRVRVYSRSRRNPSLRVTKQEGGFTTEAQAIKRENQLKRECEHELSELEAKGVLFGEMVDEWHEHFEKLKVASGQRSQVTHDDYLGGIKKWFGECWNRPALEVNPYVITSTFQKIKEAGHCFGHQKRLKRVLKSIFDFGIQSGAISLARSPTFEVVLKKEAEKKPEILTLDQQKDLIRKAFDSNHNWCYVWAVALLTGMRSGELYALQWEDIDWVNRLININKSYNCRTRSISMTTKTKRWRQLPISNELEKVLLELKPHTGQTPFVLPRMYEWDKGMQATVLRKFCYLNGLPSIKFHTLRACFATQLLRNGVEAAKVMKLCGWEELKTMQFYIRLAGVEIHGITDSLSIFDRPSLRSVS